MALRALCGGGVHGRDVRGLRERYGGRDRAGQDPGRNASAGPEISYQYQASPSMFLEPRVGVEAVWTFAQDVSIGGDRSIIASEAVGPDGVRGRVEAGLRTMMIGGTELDLSGITMVLRG